MLETTVLDHGWQRVVSLVGMNFDAIEIQPGAERTLEIFARHRTMVVRFGILTV